MALRFFIGLVAFLALASGVALADDLAEGKTPRQIFNSNCSACHHSPASLAKGRDASALAGFLSQHYTTKPEYANAVATYIAAFNAPSRRGRSSSDLYAVNSQPRIGTVSRNDDAINPLETIRAYLTSMLNPDKSVRAGDGVRHPKPRRTGDAVESRPAPEKKAEEPVDNRASERGFGDTPQ